jgi:hypothetical protein
VSDAIASAASRIVSFFIALSLRRTWGPNTTAGD